MDRNTVRLSLIGHYIDLASNKNASGDAIDLDYPICMNQL